MRVNGWNRVAMAFGLAAAASIAAAEPLGMGSPAPAMKVAKWVKGKPITRFEKGKVYVVEFWATWCVPCRESIPHLTELAKKYAGRVSFAGISSFERPETTDERHFQRVQAFVRDMGAKMGYSVGADGRTGEMGKSWMDAAGQSSIPTAFVVDKQGKVAWIGHPMQLEPVLKDVVAGTYSIKKEQDRRAAEEARGKQRMERMKPIQEALAKKDYKAALEHLEKLMAQDKEAETGLVPLKIDLLLRTDEPAAYAYIRKLAEGPYKDDPRMLNEISWAIVDDKGPAKNGDYKLAIEIAQRGVDISKDTEHLAYILDTLAYAHFKAGNVDKALELQQKAVAVCEKYSEAIPAPTKQEIMDRLVVYRKKKIGG